MGGLPVIYITKIEKLSEYIFGGNIIPYFMKKMIILI
jgi:hypothetical protein